MAEDPKDIIARADAAKKEADAKRALASATQDLAEALALEAELLEQIGDNAPTASQQEMLDYINSLKDDYVKVSQTQGDFIDGLEKVSEEAKAAAQALENYGNKTDSLIGGLGKLVGLQSEFNETTASTVLGFLESKDAANKLQESFKKTFGITNILAGAFDQVIAQSIKLTMAQDEALASFAKNGGNVNRYSKDLTNLEQSLFQAGVSVEEAGDTLLALNSHFTDLRFLSDKARADVSQTSAVLNELGVAADITAGNMQFMTKAMGISATQASETQRELFLLARTIDMPPEQMATAFGDAMPKLAAFGKESTEVFKNLQVNARAAGMEVSDVLSIVEKFDTFDTAAQSVGRLNALLGGPFLDSIEMVTTTDPTERMKMLSDAVNEAGISFDEMSYYQRKALADTMGMDIPQLAMMMANGFDAAVPAAQQSQAEILALAEEAKNFQTIQEEMNQTLRLFAQTMLPIIKSIKSVLDGIQFLTNAIPGLQQALPPLIFGLTGVYVAVQKLGIAMSKAGPLGLAIAGMTLLMQAFSSESTAMQIVLGLVGVAFIGLSIAVSTGFVTMQVASAGILTAIGAIATLVLSLASIFMHKAASPGFITILGMVGKAFKTLGMFMFPIVGIFNLLSSAIMGSAKAAHDLDGTKVEMTTKTTATSKTTAVPSGSRAGAKVVARDATGRISTANSDAATAMAGNGSAAVPAGKESVDVNVSVKADESDLIKLIVKTIEQTNSYKDSGLRATPNTIRNRI